MTGYLTQKINFEKIQQRLNAAQALDTAGDHAAAKETLKVLAEGILEEIK